MISPRSPRTSSRCPRTQEKYWSPVKSNTPSRSPKSSQAIVWLELVDLFLARRALAAGAADQGRREAAAP